MEYLSKTYRLDEEVVRSIEAAKQGGTSPNKFLRLLMGLDNGADAGQGVATSVPATVLPAATGAFEEELPGRDFRESSPEPVDRRPKNCRCLHCGDRFAGPRWANNCPKCKSNGHTNTPADCPACNEASAL